MSEIGEHLDESMSQAADARSCVHYRVTEPRNERRHRVDQAIHEGTAYGHAFRAAELAYDKGVEHGRRIGR